MKADWQLLPAEDVVRLVQQRDEARADAERLAAALEGLFEWWDATERHNNVPWFDARGALAAHKKAQP
jgi:hypothetical protein